MSVNTAWKGQRFKSKAYKQFEKDFVKIVPVNKESISKGEIEVHYKFYVKNYALTDVDNLIKQTQDLLVKRGYISDDRKIVLISAMKIKSLEEKIEVDIFSLE